MKVSSVGSANFGALNNINFKSREDKTSQNRVSNVIKSNAVKVPVIVLLAANPATLNSAIPAQPLEGAKIVQVQSPKASKADAATYTEFSSVDEAQQSIDPEWNEILEDYKI